MLRRFHFTLTKPTSYSLSAKPEETISTVNDPGLRADALGFGESVVMGVAGIGPAYSLAATAAVLIGSVGVLAPASLLYCGLIMFGIVFAFRHLNHLDTNAGASYSWLTSIFSPAIGFFAGWSVLTGSALFMVSGTLPAAAATLKLFEPSMVDNQNAVTLIAAGWVVVIGAIVAKGIKLSSYTQIVFTVVEVGVVALLVGLAARVLAPRRRMLFLSPGSPAPASRRPCSRLAPGSPCSRSAAGTSP
jgi:amino acid transporter